MKHVIRFPVMYADTDQMGIMHHSNYLKYFEAARHALLKSLNVFYSEVENSGIIMPVIKAVLDYKRPAYFEQEIIVETKICSSRGACIVFEAIMMNDSRQIICTSTITLATVGKESRKACLPPAVIRKLFISKAAQNCCSSAI
ncbi:MAG: thioesterase family protein [Bacteroidales bacterium]